MRSEDVIKSTEITGVVPFSELETERLQAMAEAGAEVLNIHRLLSKTGANVVGELLKTEPKFYEWNHYPKGDVFDRETHGQYYYHAHVAAQRFEGEHGHFHTFLRPGGMPEGMSPAKLPGVVLPEDASTHLSHLISISMNPQGFSFRLFTVNRWVTGEVWHKAADVIALLDLFEIDHTWPSWPVNRWVSAMIPLFRPQIVALVEARDRTIEGWVAEEGGGNASYEEVFEDRNREITSYLDIDLEQQVASIQNELERRDLIAGKTI